MQDVLQHRRMQRANELASHDKFIRPHNFRLLWFKLWQSDPARIPDPQQLNGGDAHAMRGYIENLNTRAHGALPELHRCVQ